MLYVGLAIGIPVGFGIALLIAYRSKARWSKILKETQEQLEKLRAKVA